MNTNTYTYFSCILSLFQLHGQQLSIGSLGSGNSEAHVSDITVNGATLSRTTNGVRIKTWQVRRNMHTYVCMSLLLRRSFSIS